MNPPPVPVKRPVLLIVIAILYLVSGVLSFFSIGLVLALSHMELPPDLHMDTALRSVRGFDIVLGFIVAPLSIAAAIFLFRLSRYALHLFSLNFAVCVIGAIYKLATSTVQAPLGWAYYIFCLVVGWAIALAVIFYCYKLTREKVLR